MLALTAEVGDLAVRTDLNKTFILRVSPASTLGNWQELLAPTDSVTSVYGRTGVVTAQSGDYTADQITETAFNKILTSAERTKLAGIATGATANSSDSALRDRATHTGTQLASTISDFAGTVLATVLTGLSLATSSVISATDTVLVALGKLQAQITTLGTSKQDTLVSGTNIKTVNTQSILGSGNITIGGSAAWGGITGTLSTQTDLQTALDGKQAAGDYTTNTALTNGLATKENTITAGTTSQYYRGDKTFQTLDKSAVGLANVDNTSDADKPVSTATQTALNAKQPLTPRVQTVVSSATVTPTASDDLVVITAQATGLTLANPTGAFVQGQSIVIRIKDNGTARTIAYGADYRAIGVTRPTTTVINKTTYLGCIYNATDSKLDIVGVCTEA
jgi:hypothetical protein